MNPIRNVIAVTFLTCVSACATVMINSRSGFLSSGSGLTPSLDGGSASTRSGTTIDPTQVTLGDIEWRMHGMNIPNAFNPFPTSSRTS